MTWQDAIKATLNEFRGQPASRGTYDCMQFVARYVYHKTGVNHAAEFSYDTTEAAEEILSTNGGVEGLISKFLGESRIPEVGDVVACHVENIIVPGVFVGPYVWAFIHDNDRGLSRLPTQSILCGWG